MLHRALNGGPMPELPEVETIRRGLLPVMAGHVITRLTLRRAGLRWPFPSGMADAVSGARVTLLRRRAKYILADLDRGTPLLFHMGMSGRILIDGAAPDDRHHTHATPAKHDHAIFDMESGARITFNDARRFGMAICKTYIDIIRAATHDNANIIISAFVIIRSVVPLRLALLPAQHNTLSLALAPSSATTT